jgi:hypothetical protein
MGTRPPEAQHRQGEALCIDALGDLSRRARRRLTVTAPRLARAHDHGVKSAMPPFEIRS